MKPMTDAEYAAMNDARTLIESERIKQDNKRKRAALIQLQKIEREAEATLKTAKNVKAKPAPKKPTPKKK